MMPDILSLSTAESSLLCSTLIATRTVTRSPFSMIRRKVKRSSASSGIIKKALIDVPLGFTIILSFRLQLQQTMDLGLAAAVVAVAVSVGFGSISNSCQPIPVSVHLTQLG